MIRTVSHLAKNAVGTAAHAVGFAKGIVESGIGLVRHGTVPQQRAAEPDPAPRPEPDEPIAARIPAQSSPTRPERDLPGPDIVLKAVPDIDELPEPIVIEADDAPAMGTGEAFQTEPKATTRSETIGHEAADVLEAEDEVILPEEAEVDVETEVGTTGADFGTNPSTGEPDHTP